MAGIAFLFGLFVFGSVQPGLIMAASGDDWKGALWGTRLGHSSRVEELEAKVESLEARLQARPEAQEVDRASSWVRPSPHHEGASRFPAPGDRPGLWRLLLVGSLALGEIKLLRVFAVTHRGDPGG